MRITDKYIYFKDGFLSQWYKSPFVDDIGNKFNTAEQYMMYGKATLFNDFEIANQILETTDPKRQKELGRQVKGFTKEMWERKCISIVYFGNMLKFTQNEDLKQQLLDTSDKILVESNSSDFVWAVGRSEYDPHLNDPTYWRGTNLLGFTLMLVRNELKQ